MPERAVFLDRDNTIIENDGYLGVAAQVKLLPGAATALSAIRALGYRLIVVSNQSGVARGMFSEADVEAVNQEMNRQLREQASAHIDASYYCPFHPEAVIAEYRVDHDWRKPKPGMIMQAAVDFNLDLAQCWMIGDQPRDIAAGTAAGCRTILLKDPDRSSSETDPPTLEVSPNFIVKTLADAARIVAREGKTPQPAGPAPQIAEPRANTVHPAIKPASRAPTAETSPAPETLAQRLARQLPEKPGEASSAQPTPDRFSAGGSKLDKNLEELVNQLRVQNRRADAPPDFSRARGAALLVQVFAILALLGGIFRWATARLSFQSWNDTYVALTNYLTAGIWVLVAIVLQLAVLALLHFSKER